MKKTKLLIPIMAVGATAAAVTPMLVSCGNSSFEITGDDIYVPTVKPWEAGEWNRVDTNTTYFKHAKDNPDVFVQDIASDLSRRVYDIVHATKNDTQDEQLRSVNIKYQMSNLSFDTFIVGDTHDHVGGKVSYTLKGSVLIDCKKFPIEISGKDGKSWKLSYVNLESIELTMKNGAFYADVLDPTNFPHSWSIQFKSGTEYLGQIDNWSVDIKVKGKYIGTQPFETFNYDGQYHYDPSNGLPVGTRHTFAEEYLWSTYDALFGTMAYSYHLQDIHVK